MIPAPATAPTMAESLLRPAGTPLAEAAVSAENPATQSATEPGAAAPSALAL
ncbi:MAG: hypothetical protein HC929_20060 [Leptolyngbyaceae cyanobacterium SM2_5_2]|nr:hypothetical protein [Leptolyngbyaceae cyanobacterium SM2_5_2]